MSAGHVSAQVLSKLFKMRPGAQEEQVPAVNSHVKQFSLQGKQTLSRASKST